MEQSSTQLTGSCHCGKVRFAVHGDVKFCAACGTPLFNTNPIDYPSLVMVYLGTVRTAAELTPRINVYRESMLPWAGEVESIKSFSQAAVRGA